MYHRSKGLHFSAALRDIRAKKPTDRVQAAEVLGDAKTEGERLEAVNALGPALNDERPEVRTTACFAVANLNTPEAPALLIPRLKDSIPEVRQSAAICLGTLGPLAGSAGFSALREALANGPADLRFQAATSLAETDPERAYVPLVQALDDPDGEVLGAVALSLGAIGDNRCVDRIVPLLEHPRGETRLDAACALAELGDDRALETLAAGLATKDGGWDAVTGLESLGAASTKTLLDFLNTQDGEPRVRIKAAGVVLARPISEEQAERPRRCLLMGLWSRKLPMRGLAVDEITKVAGPWARKSLIKLRGSLRGRRLRDEIDAALQAIGE